MSDPAIPDRTAFVFVHGFLGTDEVRFPFFTCECFRGLKGFAKTLDVPVLAVRLPHNAGVADRGAMLADFLARAGYDRYALIGHSMGGLVSRYVAAKCDPQKKIRAVATLATPHRGSVLAERTLRGRGPLSLLARLIARRALENLTPDFCEAFNVDVPDREDVLYLSWAAARPVGEMPVFTRRWWRQLYEEGGANDGQVTVASAQWTGFQGDDILHADHWELLGWSLWFPSRVHTRPFDHHGLYARVIDKIRAGV